MLLQRRPLHVLREAAVAAPVIGHRAAAVRDDELEGGEVLEQVCRDELHEGGGVAVDVVGAGGVEVGVAGGRHVHHGRHVELHHFLVDGIPVAVGERRVLPPAAGRVRVQVAADEAQLVHAALQLGDAVLRRDARHLRQLADADEVLGVELHRPVDQVVADARPLRRRGLVAEMVRHAGGARREDGEIGAALALQFQLRALQALADLVVADAEVLVGGAAGGIRQRRELAVAEDGQLLRCRRVVAVAVDDHRRFPCRGRGQTPRDHLRVSAQAHVRGV